MTSRSFARGLALALVTAAASVATTTALRPTPAVSSTWVHHVGLESYDDEHDVSVLYDVIISEPYLRVAEPSFVTRMTSTALQVRAADWTLNFPHVVKAVPLDGDQAIEMIVGDANIHAPKTIAANLLGVDLEARQPEYLPTYRFTIAPVAGLTWADVDDHADLDASLTAMR